MIGRNQQFISNRLNLLSWPLDLDPEDLCPLSPIHCQHAMRRHLLDMLIKLEVVTKMLRLLREWLPRRFNTLAPHPPLFEEESPQLLSEVGPLTKKVSNNMTDTQKSIRHSGHADILVDKVGSPVFDQGCLRISRQNFLCKRLEPTLLGLLGQGKAAWLEGQIEVFQNLWVFN